MATGAMTSEQWAELEFADASLGDARRTKRLVRIGAALVERARGTLPGSLGGWAESKAAYRLLSNPEVAYEEILAPHLKRVREACRQPGEYLLVEDTTSLDFTSHVAAQDLGRIGDDRGRGLWLHSTLALPVQRWNADQEPEVVLEGLFDQRYWARTMPTLGSGKGKRRKGRERPRESDRWARAAVESGAPPSGVDWTYVADRESDIYEAFARCRDNGWHYVVRANQPRALAETDGSVFTAVAEAPPAGRMAVDLRSRPGQAARRAELVLRTCAVTLRGPHRPGRRVAPFTVTAVEARETAPPQGARPVHWVLLTDRPCSTPEAVLRTVKTYTRRWLIEEYHKALKTGTGIERSQLATAARITALLGILSVVAVQLLNAKLLATTRPDDPVAPEQMDETVRAVLEATCGRPAEGWTNKTFHVAIARMGGYLNRKGDGPPGWITIWRGFQKLMLLAQGYNLNCG